MKDKQSGGIVKTPVATWSNDRYSLCLDEWYTIYYICSDKSVNNWPKISLEKRVDRRGPVEKLVVPEVFL